MSQTNAGQTKSKRLKLFGAFAAVPMLAIVLASFFLLNGCTGLPKNVEPVQNFQLPNYLGKWYEIARLDHSFERGLQQVSAEYSMRDDGGIRVLNRGYSAEEKAWDEAEGRAYFVNIPTDKEPAVGHLKVSFFGPFYSTYAIFELADDYNHAFVSGYNHDYLWLLSRTPIVSEALKQRFVERSKALGFDTQQLIFVDQSKNINVNINGNINKNTNKQ